jgi:hypothetical protein
MGCPPFRKAIKPNFYRVDGALRHRPTPQSADAQIPWIGRFATLWSIKDRFPGATDMASTTTASAGRFSYLEQAAATGGEPPNVARHKLDRLRELRAVIDTLRHERESRDPLYAWIIERERAENHRHD